MKVLQINNFHYPRGGSDRYFLDISRLLCEEGNEIKTFSTINPNNVDENLLVIPPVQGTNTEQARGIKNVLNFLYSFNTKNKMQEAINKFHPDIAHLHIYYGQLTASILKPLCSAGIPIVQTLHEYKIVCATHGLYANGQFCDSCGGKHFWHAVLKKCNRGSIARSFLSMMESYLSNALGAIDSISHFIAVSAFQKKQLTRLGIPEDKITVLHHFIEPTLVPPDQPGKYFLFVGRISEEKGINVLLDAYKLLGQSAPSLKIVGSHNHPSHLDNKIKYLGLEKKVEWIGFKTGKELTQLYKGCLALINPSQLNETFGLTCLEALAQGRPVIASRVGAFPEIITHNENGFLVKAGSPMALAEAMTQLLENPYQAQAMGLYGLEKVNQLFSKVAHYQKLCEVYRKVTI